MEQFSMPSRPWLRPLLIVAAIVGIIFGLARINQAMRLNHLASAPTEVLHQELQSRPDDVDLLYHLAYKHLKSGENEEAFQLMQRLVRLQPQSVNAWYGLARCAAPAGHALETVEAYRRVLALDPKNKRARLALGQVYAQAGLYTDAVREYDLARDTMLAASYGDTFPRCLLRRGRLQEAWDLAQLSVAMNLKQEDIFLVIEELGHRLKREAEAEALLRKRLNLTPQYPEPVLRHAMARLLLAQSEAPEALPTAEVMLRALIDREETPNGESFYYLGRTLMARQRWREAQAPLERAVQLKPGYREALEALREVYTRQGDRERAARLQARLARLDRPDASLQRLRAAARARPEDREAQIALVRALQEKGLYGEAAEVCETFLERHSQDAAMVALRDDCRYRALTALSRRGRLRMEADPVTPAATP
ncbi:MAG: tetratricopeptide repeat protein [Chloroherpetonaceae bacterium]|nr:tetratricopeptide repeat protein [Chthonomonadaceae bacterium]MDW8207801.1 tetratricopeptide repeat protein [Chloroherpetonaceae bacterium]